MQTKTANLDKKIQVVYVPTDSLHPSPTNPRFWSDKARADLKQSILRYGLTEPLLVNAYEKRKNRILSGHFRWTIAKELKIQSVPVVFVTIASIKKERELLLRMNANQGEWNFELLKSFEIDLLLDVGFDSDSLTAVFDDNLEVNDDGFDQDAELKKIKRTDIKPGDLFSLGRHRLICGNALDPKVVSRLMGDARADVINIDPPYNINLDYNRGVGGKGAYGGQTKDNKSDTEYRAFIKTLMQNALSVAKADCHAFFWTDERWVWLFQELYREVGLDSKRLCIWIKDNASPTVGVAFNKVTEFCLYGLRGKPFLSDKVTNLNEIMNKNMTTGNRLPDEILDQLNIWLVKRLPGNQMEHPTQKSPTLYEKSLRRCSRPGDAVVDLTSGSGTVLSACHQLKRVAYLADVEPLFCQLSINRFKQISNEKITKLKN
jgi:site-specific DNA-methyltransferase (adenine-specific)